MGRQTSRAGAVGQANRQEGVENDLPFHGRPRWLHLAMSGRSASPMRGGWRRGMLDVTEGKDPAPNARPSG